MDQQLDEAKQFFKTLDMSCGRVRPRGHPLELQTGRNVRRIGSKHGEAGGGGTRGHHGASLILIGAGFCTASVQIVRS